jgi:FolB domain-containing protein
MDMVEIDGLRLRCIIGCTDEERRDRQDVVLDLRIDVDARAAGRTDRLDDAWNYRTPTKSVIRAVEGRTWFTVEALAAAVARIIVVDHGAHKARVRVHKPGALRFADSVGLVLERARADFAAADADGEAVPV